MTQRCFWRERQSSCVWAKNASDLLSMVARRPSRPTTITISSAIFFPSISTFLKKKANHFVLYFFFNSFVSSAIAAVRWMVVLCLGRNFGNFLSLKASPQDCTLCYRNSEQYCARNDRNTVAKEKRIALLYGHILDCCLDCTKHQLYYIHIQSLQKVFIRPSKKSTFHDPLEYFFLILILSSVRFSCVEHWIILWNLKFSDR